ncbi:MAG: tRNA (guanosine-2'-O-)-methyltransferase [Flavobacteriales bacterium]|jgi:tRNA (guanosine-2'-O-)-methyltransferase
MQLDEKKALIEHLKQFATEERINKFDSVIQDRTKHITVALENIYQPHNASAVMRSCDCFGIQNVHVIENTNEYTISKGVALGSTKWVDIHQYNETDDNTLACVNKLKADGYTIVATSPHANDVDLDQLPVDKPIALFFGTELTGLTPTMLDAADVFMKIPMFGFTESFNISVCAALTVHYLTTKLHKSNVAWELNEIEQTDLYLSWLKKSIKTSDALERDFLTRKV